MGMNEYSPPHSTICISNLASDITEASLKVPLNAYGAVHSIELKISQKNGKQYEFVKFRSVGTAARALTALGSHSE